MRKSKIVFSVILALIITITSLSVGTLAAEDYSKKTVSRLSTTVPKNLIEKVDCEVKISVDEKGKEKKTYVYDIDRTSLVLIVTFSDNSGISGSFDEIEAQTGIRPEISPLEFTTENHEGLHPVTITYKGVSTNISIRIVKNELKSLTGHSNVVTENSDGEFIETAKGKIFKYDIEDKIRYRVEFDQFTDIEGTAKELEERFGCPVTLNYDPEKDVFKPGDNYVTASFMDKECKIKVYVNENPINKISATAKVELVENVDGYWDSYVDEKGKEVTYFHYDIFASEPYFELKLKEDKQHVGDRAEIENYMRYEMTEVNTQSSKPWSVGKNKATILFMGHECTFDVTVVESNIKTVTISGENDLKVKISYKDGKQTTHTAKDFVIDTYSDNNFYGSLITDKGIVENVMFGFDGEKIFVTIEGVKSNALNNNWLPAVISADTFLYYAVAYSITNDSFAGCSNKNPSAYLDDLVSLALYLCAEPVPDEEHGVYYYHTADLKSTEMYIKEVFGVSGLDLTKAKGYNPETGFITVPREAAVQLVYQVLNMEYKDNQWVFQMVFSATDFDYADEVEIVLNSDFTIASVKFMSKVGDVNGDGNITAVDARVVLQYVAGIIKEDKLNTVCADVNGDGYITAVDARIILQYVAGLT